MSNALNIKEIERYEIATAANEHTNAAICLAYAVGALTCAAKLQKIAEICDMEGYTPNELVNYRGEIMKEIEAHGRQTIDPAEFEMFYPGA